MSEKGSIEFYFRKGEEGKVLIDGLEICLSEVLEHIKNDKWYHVKIEGEISKIRPKEDYECGDESWVEV